jgi:hypothetical protein
MKSPARAAALSLIFATSPVAAQPNLPGAAALDPAGTVEKAPRSRPSLRKAPRSAAVHAPPGVVGVIGRPLMLNGANGQLQFSGPEDAPRIDRLILLGEVISDPTQQCRIEVGGGAPIALKDLGRPDGLQRFAAEIPACPFEFDVLDGAVLVPAQLSACVFKEADCQASPSGLWGPAGGAIEKDARLIEQARASAEAALTSYYRALDERFMNDPAKSSDLAGEQSRFTSDRQDICRQYARESVHAFCAARLTEARAASLKLRLDEVSATAGPEKSSSKRKRKPSQ